MPPVIEIDGLRKEYRRLRGSSIAAVDGLDLHVPEGGVYGFLGPNGSGKTTTIRCLLGLVAPTSGSCRVMQRPVPGGLADVMGRVGSIVETPTLFPNFSGRRNLMLLGRLHGLGPNAVDRVLEKVGLAERSRDLVKHYSLGMKQRLGIAAALLKDPALLILDEPANGLDPAGIREIRELIRALGEEGRTVFVSSHILNEVQQTCDRVAILSRGRTVAQGRVDEVLRTGRVERMLVKTADLASAADALTASGLTPELHHDHLVVETPREGPDRLTRLLAGHDVWISELRPVEASLEDVFLELTGEPPHAEEPT